MKEVFLSVLMCFVQCALFSVDLSTQRKIYETDDFAYYAEDTNDYTELIELIETKNKEFEDIFRKKISKIQVYVFHDQISFSKHVFNSDIPVHNATGLADHVSMRFFITSFYDTCKSKERLLQTPIHELVHIYFPSSYIWIREGIACYYAGMLSEVSLDNLPSMLTELRFYIDGISETKKAYNHSGWIVKYIIEEICDSDISKFTEFARNPDDFTFLGFRDEQDFFKSWHTYMRLKETS
jgi:hypothetical protein